MQGEDFPFDENNLCFLNTPCLGSVFSVDKCLSKHANIKRSEIRTGVHEPL